MIVLAGIVVYLLLGLFTTIYAINTLKDGWHLTYPWLFTLSILIFPYIWYLIYEDKKKQ